MTPREQYEAYLVYLRMKIEQKDWHGVADAAMDLRELEASFPELKKEAKQFEAMPVAGRPRVTGTG